MNRIILFALLTINGFLCAGPSKERIEKAFLQVLAEYRGLEQRNRSNSGEDCSPEGSLEELPIDDPVMEDIFNLIESRGVPVYLYGAIANRVFRLASAPNGPGGGCLLFDESFSSSPSPLHASSSHEERFP